MTERTGSFKKCVLVLNASLK